VALQPISQAARLLGLRLGGQGQTAASYQLLRPWALQNPEDAEARLAAAVGAVQLGRIEEAEELLRGVDDDDPKVRLLRADVALKRRDPATAVELLEPLAEVHPPAMEVDLLVLLATAQIELGRSDAARELLADRATGRPRLALVLAQAQHTGGDPTAALATLAPFADPVLAADRQALPASSAGSLVASIVREQGRAFLALERFPEAVRSLERSSELDPWSRETWQELARAHAAVGQSEAAERALGRFEQLAEARQQAKIPGLAGQRRLSDATGQRLSEAMEWQARGEVGRALAIVRQEIALAPRDLRPRLLEVRLLLTLERWEEARASIGATVELFPEHPDARHFRAVVAMSLGDFAAAEEDLRQVLAQTPYHLPAKNDLALVLARRGEAGEARRLLEEILAEHPDDPLARERLRILDGANISGNPDNPTAKRNASRNLR
jgi:tetratricopeptide (TPR) repeat protein